MRRAAWPTPTRDLAPVAMLGSYPLILVVNPALPVASVADLIDYARRDPGKVNYSSPGVGRGTQIVEEVAMFRRIAAQAKLQFD